MDWPVTRVRDREHVGLVCYTVTFRQHSLLQLI